MPSGDDHGVPDAGSNGDARRSDAFFALVYAELRRLAERVLASDPAGQSLGPTGLLHEAYLRLKDEGGGKWSDRGYFFATASKAMRRILIERARRRGRPKHGGGRARLPLDGLDPAAPPADADMLVLDDLLDALAREDRRAAAVVELRVFGGLELPEVGKVVGVSLATVKRDWIYGRAWLRDRLRTRGGAGDGR
jgi:RNA polymerase sigma factor (TIGR02999 family)